MRASPRARRRTQLHRGRGGLLEEGTSVDLDPEHIQAARANASQRVNHPIIAA